MVAFTLGAIAAQMAAGDAGTTAVKGKVLEAVVAETFCKMEGVGILYTNVVDEDNSSEIDILLYNKRDSAGLPFLPDHILVECKNWAAAVDTKTVRSFVSKLQQANLDFGILVASNGITGSAEDRTAAHAYLRREFDRTKLKVLVITRAELELLTSTEDLYALLSKKFGGFIMGLAHF